MKCRDFEVAVLNLARGELIDAMRRHYQTHTELFLRCANRMAEEQALNAGVRVVVDEIAVQEAPPNVQTVLIKAFRQQVAAAKSTGLLSLSTYIRDTRAIESESGSSSERGADDIRSFS